MANRHRHRLAVCRRRWRCTVALGAVAQTISTHTSLHFTTRPTWRPVGHLHTYRYIPSHTRPDNYAIVKLNSWAILTTILQISMIDIVLAKLNFQKLISMRYIDLVTKFYWLHLMVSQVCTLTYLIFTQASHNTSLPSLVILKYEWDITLKIQLENKRTLTINNR